jgi:hypothetical protein
MRRCGVTTIYGDVGQGAITGAKSSTVDMLRCVTVLVSSAKSPVTSLESCLHTLGGPHDLRS